ncbi:hypothetical protein RND81_02G218000 [Saponaria officinalis]|uniref:F-box domain-containing protein n=1 Tax=Saponaria officinalis TaxID=3572 RepID=A0AAW1MVW1_SAPOF
MFVNTDQMTEILVRLPIKDVIRSKLVCKCWNTIICSPEFARFHRQHQCHRDDNLLLHVFMFCPSRRTNFPNLYTFKIDPCDLDLFDKSCYWACTLKKPAEKLRHKFNNKNHSHPIATCNGLICFVVGLKHKAICLWNPAIHEYCHIRGPRRQSNKAPFACIFTLKTKKWRQLECSADDSQITAFFLVKKIETHEPAASRPVLAGDTLYWGIKDDQKTINPNNHLLAFNITKESFEIIHIPKTRNNCTNTHHCVEFFICQIRQYLCACWVYNELDDNDPRGPWLYLEGWILENKQWKFLLKFRSFEKFFHSEYRDPLPKLFELEEQHKFLVLSTEFKSGVVFDPRGPIPILIGLM